MNIKEKKHVLNFVSLCRKHLISFMLVEEDLNANNLNWENMSIEEIEEFILNNY